MTLPFYHIPSFVIPAKAGIHGLSLPHGRKVTRWIPDQVGNDKVLGCDAVCGAAA